MCGIAGIAGPRWEPAQLARLVDAQRHRGPDGEGLFTSGDGAVGLGHRRLAILDLIFLRIDAGQAVEVAVELEAMAAGQAEGLPRDAALHALGELYIREKQPEKARTYFETLIEEFPSSPYVVGARRRVDELG